MIAVIGAGAAGLAAARTLHDAGQNVEVFEARDRIGGRVWTDFSFADFPIELGAEFIHGQHVLTHALLGDAGLSTIPVTRLDNLRWSDGVSPAYLLPSLSDALRHSITSLFASYQSLLSSPSSDVSLAEALAACGHSENELDMADVLFAQTCCAPLDSLSLADLQREAAVDHAGKDEFRIKDGYAALFNHYSRDLTIRLGKPVHRINWNKASVTLKFSDGGESFAVQRCIITVPVPLLAQGKIRFEPALSEAKLRAIHAFRTEAATKLIYHFRESLWDENLTYMAHEGLAARWWTPGYGRPGAAVICAYITADRARRIDALDESGAEALGLAELAVLLGLPLDRLYAELLNFHRISWANDPLALGGYAHIPPGAADARPMLAAPEGDVLFFAGEATACDSNPQTVHGALESGIRAARECLASL